MQQFVWLTESSQTYKPEHWAGKATVTTVIPVNGSVVGNIHEHCCAAASTVILLEWPLAWASMLLDNTQASFRSQTGPGAIPKRQLDAAILFQRLELKIVDMMCSMPAGISARKWFQVVGLGWFGFFLMYQPLDSRAAPLFLLPGGPGLQHLNCWHGS